MKFENIVQKGIKDIGPNNLIKDHILSKINEEKNDIFTNEITKVKRLV